MANNVIKDLQGGIYPGLSRWALDPCMSEAEGYLTEEEEEAIVTLVAETEVTWPQTREAERRKGQIHP